MEDEQQPIDDATGLDRAYAADDSVYVHGDTEYVAGTKTLSDWATDPLIALGMTSSTKRFGEATGVLTKNPQVRHIVGHSLGGSVALELAKDNTKQLDTRTYGAPVFSASGGERYKEHGDPFSILDFGAKTSLPGGFNPHDYGRIAKGRRGW